MILRQLMQSAPRTENLGHPSSPGAAWLTMPDTHAGVDVNDSNALTCSAVFAGVRLMAGTAAQLPLKVYRRRKGGGSEVARDHELAELLSLSPSPEQTSVVQREQFHARKIVFGNGYQVITRRNGAADALWPVHPDRVQLKRRRNGDLYYEISSSNGGGKPREYRPRDVIHVPNMPINGLQGIGLVDVARQAIGMALAAEKHGALLFKNGARPSGILKTASTFKDRAVATKNIREMWEKAHGGENQHRVAVFDWGLEWQALGFTSEEAQFFELRGFQVVEVARFIGAPPHLLQHLDKATFNNIEELGAAFVRYSQMLPLVQYEQELTRKLIAPEERHRYFIKHNVDALVRGSMETRAKFYEVAGRVFMTPNEIRGKEDLPPMEGGDEIQAELNRAPLSQSARQGYEALVVDQLVRSSRREKSGLQSTIQKSLPQGVDACEREFERFLAGQREFMTTTFDSLIGLGEELGIEFGAGLDSAAAISTSWVSYSRRVLLDALHSPEPAAALEECLATWSSRPAGFATFQLFPEPDQESHDAAA